MPKCCDIMHQLLIRIYYSFLVRHENYWLCFAYEKDYHWAEVRKTISLCKRFELGERPEEYGSMAHGCTYFPCGNGYSSFSGVNWDIQITDTAADTGCSGIGTATERHGEMRRPEWVRFRDETFAEVLVISIHLCVIHNKLLSSARILENVSYSENRSIERP